MTAAADCGDRRTAQIGDSQQDATTISDIGSRASMVASDLTDDSEKPQAAFKKWKTSFLWQALRRPFQRTSRRDAGLVDDLSAQRIHASGAMKVPKSARRASFNDTIGRKHVNAAVIAAAGAADAKPTKRQARSHRRSISIVPGGVHVGWKELPSPGRQRKVSKTSKMRYHEDKALPAQAQVTCNAAIAARHARVLERIIVSGSSLELEIIKAKRENKFASAGKSMDATKVQPYSVVAPRKVGALKEALLDTDMANGIIGELRAMMVDEDVILGAMSVGEAKLAVQLGGNEEISGARTALEELADAGDEQTQRGAAQAKRMIRPQPVRVVCLDHTEQESEALAKSGDSAARRVDVCTLYARSSAPNSETGRETASSAAGAVSSAPPATGAMASAAVLTGGAIGALGQMLWYSKRELNTASPGVTTTAIAPKKDALTSPEIAADKSLDTPQTQTQNATTSLGEAVQYAVEIVDDARQGDVKEAMTDGVRFTTAGLEMSQPMVGAVAKAVEEHLLPANKAPSQPHRVATAVTSTAVAPVSINGKTTTAAPRSAVLATAEERLAASNKLSEAPVHDKATTGLPMGVDMSTAAHYILSPSQAVASTTAEHAGMYDALASVSAAALEYSQGGPEAMLDIKPPTDRMAVFIHWWGFELTLPPPSIKYLSTARSVSGAFMSFLQTMATTSGAPELLPFIRYISTFMDMEFSAIKSQDKGHGVVVAATWLMPLALVPRPWDYGVDGMSTSKTAADTDEKRATGAAAGPEAPPLPMPVISAFVRKDGADTPTALQKDPKAGSVAGGLAARVSS